MKTTSISPILFRMWRTAVTLLGDCRGIAATEFAVIVPVMLVMFLGTVAISSGLAISRKVTLIARTASDLTSQSITVADTDITNFFTASYAILLPYSSAPNFAPANITISELYVDPNTLAARVQWSRLGTITPPATAGNPPTVVLGTGHAVSSNITIPSQLQVPGTYLLYSEASQLYTPAVGSNIMGTAGVTLRDFAFTRPRQSSCVFYPSTPSPATCPTL
jgi:Flp pilus assembly protein TadG